MLIRYLWGFILFALLSPTSAASFDCSKARNKIEKTICKNTELSALDDELNTQFKKALGRAQNPRFLIDDQRVWIKNERNSCEDLPCLQQVYANRIAELATIQDTNAASCPITEQGLLGGWKGIGSSDFDEMAFEQDGKKRSFLSWRHQHLEMTGSWEFKNCEIHIAHSDNSKLSFDYKVKGYARGILYLQEEGRKSQTLYQQIK